MIVNFSFYQGPLTLTDSLGNTYTQLATYNSGGGFANLWYYIGSNVSSGMTLIETGANGYAALSACVFSNASTYDGNVTGGSGSYSSTSAPTAISLTPTGPQCVSSQWIYGSIL